MLRSPGQFAVRSAVPATELTDLNPDCLAEIFQKLEINDLYALACALPSFRDVFMLFNRKFEYTINEISAANLLHFLRAIGMQIKVLTVSVGERHKNSLEVIEFFECVQLNCENLKRLTVKKWTHLNFNRFPKLLNRLETLQLIECDNVESNEIMNKQFAFKPWNWSPLNTIARRISCLTDLSKITTLKLHTCKGFYPQDLMEFLQKNNRLTELSMFALDEFQNSQLGDQFFDSLSQHLQLLEIICIDVQTTSHIQFIANLPKLRTLQLLDYSVFNDRIVDRLLRRICDSETIIELDLYHCNLGQSTYRFISQLRNLQTLKLRKNFWVTDQHLQSLNLMQSLRTVCCFDNVILTDDGVLSIVKMAPKLTQLDISWCFMISNRTINDIQRLLYNQSHRPKLNILAGGRTKITESILDVSKYIESFHLIQSFIKTIF